MAKKKTTGTHIAQHLPDDARGLHTRGVAMLAAIVADTTHFGSPYPPAPEVAKELKDLGDALQAAEGGDPVAIAALGVAEGKVRQTLALLGKYVERVLRSGSVEDAPAIISSVLMFESQVGQRSPKAALAAKEGATSGIVLLIALAVPSALVYYWELSLDQVTWSSLPQTAPAHTSIAGLTPGKVYYFRFHAFRRDGSMTDPSQIVSFMVR